MESGSLESALRQIRTLYAVGTVGGRSDAQLLELYLDRNADAAGDAFEALVERHGPTVLGVCRRMLPNSHDCEDAFQATFFVLARRAASIGRREHLASWLYGVAVRTAKEVRRQAARERAVERRLMDSPRVELEPNEDRDERLAFLDEELNRLPERYRAALVACELEGKTRSEAAQQLGLPEGTLSTHLARGRKLLRERLLRRGVSLGVGPLAGLPRPIAPVTVPERLMGSTVQATLDFVSGGGASGTVPGVAATLAERVLKIMFLLRLTLIVASLMAAGTTAASVLMLGLSALAAGSRNPDPPRPGPDDLPGRVVDKSGAGVPGVQLWVIDGPGWDPETVAKATTDGDGRFAMPWARDGVGRRNAQNFGLFARAGDGRIGWQHPPWRNSADGKSVEIELKAVGDVRGRLTDQNARAIGGVEVAVVTVSRSGDLSTGDFIHLSAEITALLKTVTAADGSFVLKGIPHGAGVLATIASPAFGSPRISWDTARPATIVLDGRLGQIKGRLKAFDSRGLPNPLGLGLHSSPRAENAVAGPCEVFCRRDSQVDKDCAFQFDNLPPGRYVVNAYFDQDAIVAIKPQHEITVGPGAVAEIEIPLQRLPTITGRLVDAQTGKGVAGVGLVSLLREEGKNSNLICGETTTDTEGRYKISARPGNIQIAIRQVPKTHLGLKYSEFPKLDVNSDQTLPELKLARATGLDGVVVDRTGQPVIGAEVYVVAPEPPGVESHDRPILTGPGGAFHLEQLDPDDSVSLRARTDLAATDGAVVVQPKEVRGKLILTVLPAHTFRIRGMVTDQTGKRIAGAKATLWWHRSYVSRKQEFGSGGVGSVFETFATGENGWFVFRNLWPGDQYSIHIEARGHGRVETAQFYGKAGETHDVGKVVLNDSSGYVRGRIIGSDGKPIAGANVFNRGDAPEPVATSTDSQGGFRLEGLFPGRKCAFVRKEGYRFTGIKTDADVDGVTITLKKTGEPPPTWKPVSAARYDDQRGFAKKVLIRLWEKYGADPEKTGAWRCIEDMAAIDLNLALEWSVRHGRRYDRLVRRVQAREIAETDGAGALAILKPDPVSVSQPILQELAARFAKTDPMRAILFAEEAAAQARGLVQPDGAAAMAQAGATLVNLGQTDAGRTLIDLAAQDAAKLGTKGHAGYDRSLVAEALAPLDLNQAIALIEPIEDDKEMPLEKGARYARVATAIAKTDTTRAVALLDSVGGRPFDHELAKTEIAYKIGALRPDEAIRIIEGIKRTRWSGEYQAAAFGWLAVALAPRDRDRAFGLIDRALAILIDQRDAVGRPEEMAVAARIAICARRIGYPDMESVLLRVLATRSGGDSRVDGRVRMRFEAQAALALALTDPSTARTLLEEMAARSGLDPGKQWDVREAWLTAWALVDLNRAEGHFEAALTVSDETRDAEVWNASFFQMVEFLVTPPERRDQALGERSSGGFWWPDSRR